MPPTTFHWVLSTEPTITVGLQFIPAACMDKAVELTLHNVVANYVSTNVEHAAARWLLVRVYIYQAESLMAGHATDGHVPELTAQTGIIDLLYLQSFVVLCAAFDTPSYGALHNGLLPISSERFEELRFAWKTAERLLTFIREKFTFSLLPEDNGEDDDEDDDDDDDPEDFTAAAMVSIYIPVSSMRCSFVPAMRSPHGICDDVLYCGLGKGQCSHL